MVLGRGACWGGAAFDRLQEIKQPCEFLVVEVTKYVRIDLTRLSHASREDALGQDVIALPPAVG